MIIAVDFDGTCSLDPEGFIALGTLMRSRGHVVLFVTQRCEQFRADIENVMGPLDLSFEAVVWASGKSKEEACKAAGYTVNVWIDDAPYSVYTALTYRGCAEHQPG